MIIVLEGPEKVGKTTLANKIAEETGATIRHWGQIKPDDRAYTSQLKRDSLSDEWFIWDRCWPSEHVYGKLLERGRRLAEDPWLGEWLHGRAARIRIIMVPDRLERLEELRDETDLPVRPSDELLAYSKYARRFGYKVLVNEYTEKSLNEMWDTIRKRMIPQNMMKGVKPKDVAGDIRNGIVWIEELEAKTTGIPGGWMPFSSPEATRFARQFGDEVFDYAYTGEGQIDPLLLADKGVIAFGDSVGEWCQSFRTHRLLLLPSLQELVTYDDKTSPYHADVVDITKKFILGECVK